MFCGQVGCSESTNKERQGTGLIVLGFWNKLNKKETCTALKTNMDTQNDGLEHGFSFQIYGYFGGYLCEKFKQGSTT